MLTNLLRGQGWACFGLGCNILNLVILYACCNDTDEKGEPINLVDSLASAYKPYHGNQIKNEKNSKKIKSLKGSFAQ